jgi:hypothetical protein
MSKTDRRLLYLKETNRMLNIFKTIRTTNQPVKGVWLAATPGTVTLVHSGIKCKLTPKLAREVSKDLLRFADLAEGMPTESEATG